MDALAFQRKWIDASQQKERSAHVTHFNLLRAPPTWFQNAHATLDRAVRDASGWPADETPADVEEDVILSRLLALNGERVRKA